MVIGDLVRIKERIFADRDWHADINSQVGIILDEYRDMATTQYEVQFVYERGWFDEFELRVVSGARELDIG
jgi:hypothetical protein